MEQFREFYQTQRILELLEQAAQSKGRCKPVLAVGRDGISLREYRHRCFEVATAATLTVYDRRGRRLGTVYLAFSPQLGQQQMTDQLTSLIKSVLRNWEGGLPRLCYVTDAGESETKYYRRILKPMRHPRTGVPLDWQRIVDYYHLRCISADPPTTKPQHLLVDACRTTPELAPARTASASLAG
jgi:hypothetical protein